MNLREVGTTLLTAIVAVAVIGCSGSRFQMNPIGMEEKFAGQAIKDVLVIVVINDLKIRAIFEKHFKDWLEAKGVEAVTSVDVLPIDSANKLKKEAIVDVVDRYGNDSILITHIVGFEETEVFSRDRPRYYYNYYGFYNYAWGYVTWPTIYGENVHLTLETGLYDVKTESLIWAGESELTNPKTTGEAIGEVVVAVMQELEKNGLVPQKPSAGSVSSAPVRCRLAAGMSPILDGLAMPAVLHMGS
jgi:hypothetical protein